MIKLKFVSRLKCPTCDDAHVGYCCSCGCELPGTAELEPCPFASEIDGDESLHLMCESCLEESARSI